MSRIMIPHKKNDVSISLGALEIPARWGWTTKIIASHIIVVVGLVANSLTFAVMKNPQLRYKSYSHYLSALAVFDR